MRAIRDCDGKHDGGGRGVVMLRRLDLSLSVHICFSKAMCIYMCLSRFSLCEEKGSGS